MDITTLEKANELNKKIKGLTEALNCFEIKEENQKPISLNPEILIEYDVCDGRESFKIPMLASKELIEFLKSEIIKSRDTLVSEFNAL